MCIPGLLYIGTEVTVAQHDSLGIAGSARSIDDGCNVHRLRLLDGAVAGVLGLIHADKAEVADIYHDMEPPECLLADLGQLLAGHEDSFGIRMLQDVLDLVGRDLWQHRYGNPAVGSDGEERHAPVGHILGEDRYLVRGIDAEGGEDAGNTVAGFLETGVCIVLTAIDEVRGSTFGIFGRGIIQDVRKCRKTVSHQCVLYFSGCLPPRSMAS